MENYQTGAVPPQQPVPPTEPMDIQTAVRKVLNNYATFNGRASRAEFWWWILATWVVSVVLGILGRFIGFFEWINGIYSLAILIPTLAVSWRRLHDTGRAGGWWFINFIPVVGWILFILWTVKPSEPQPNRFGPVPAN